MKVFTYSPGSFRETSYFLYILKRKKKDIVIKTQWLLWKYFNVKRKIPCGRVEKDKFLCCLQPINSKTTYLSEDRKEAYCKVCNSLRVRANHIIDLDNLWSW